MDAFESLVSMLLSHQGYWARASFKVELSKEEKQAIGRHSSPRWEVDLVAYKGSKNEVLAIECKSYLDSTGVVFRNGAFEPPERYKLFTEDKLREVVMRRLAAQLESTGACAPNPRVTLCLAVANIARKSDRAGMAHHFSVNGWLLLDSDWVRQQLRRAADSGYENDIAFVVSKILLRA